MSLSASPKVSNKQIRPVTKTDGASANFTPDFLSTYEAQNKKHSQKIGDRQDSSREQSAESPAPQDKKADSRDLEKPEIFKLLKKYRFKDFLQLALTSNDFQLSKVIRKNRKLRGVSLLSPFSETHTENDAFINQVKEYYLDAKWLMEHNNRHSYSGIL